MKKVFKIAIRPFYIYIKWLLAAAKLILKHPTLKLGNKASVVKSTIGRYNYFSTNSSFVNSTIGDYSYLGQNTKINNTKIGKFTCIGPNVLIGLGEHPTHTFVSVHPVFYSVAKQVGTTFVKETFFDEFSSKIVIGNDVWIGSGVSILGSVKIGDGAIIASGAVVTKDVDSYTIVGGVPAKQIKKRFTEDEIVFLKETRWWDKSDEWLKENVSRFHDIKKFVK